MIQTLQEMDDFPPPPQSKKNKKKSLPSSTPDGLKKKEARHG
jgi:hypothetical protein